MGCANGLRSVEEQIKGRSADEEAFETDAYGVDERPSVTGNTS